ncbi:histidine kinase [Sphingomonas sp. Leaf24]|uniref:GAF domain-containing hybrid sensor histidine kinase/response regulator n=1 Tax=unclassified Sphingomonas TaxID=196159 RepID=UPI0006F5D609|nr:MULTISPECIES: PAS domain-containing protein [unclassified Sphingomonas]KQM12845.1 histidine kinase [Sphingomonas sp. Leaf5]KQM94482.1 histidine kinase [Sphingomonas sp. Leaf24]
MRGDVDLDGGSSERAQRDDHRIALEIAGTDSGTDPFVAAVRATRMPMVVTNPRLPDNPLVFVNDAFCRLTGYDREWVIGRNCRFLQGEDSDPAAVAQIRAAVAAEESIEIDIRNYRRDGTAFWNRLLLAPVPDADGKLAYFFASQLDVTAERDRVDGLESTNAALLAELAGRFREQEEREREMLFALEAGRFGTWSFDRVTRQLSMSAICRANFGFDADYPPSPAEISAILHPDDRPAAMAAIEASFEGASLEIEVRVRLPDGETRWIASRGQPTRNAAGDITRLTGVSIDVTAYKRLERMRAAMAELNEMLRLLDDPVEMTTAASRIIGEALGVDRVGYGIVDRAAETITIERDWNTPGVASLAGVLQFRDYGCYIDDLKRGETAVVEDARIDPRTADTAAQLESINARAFINMPLTELGGLVALLYANHGEPRVWRDDEIAFVREVAERTRAATERRRAERELAALASSLEEQVVDRTRALVTAQDALRQSQKMEAIGQLTGGVAHDFNNLLTIVRSAVDLLRQPALAPERRERYLSAISDTVDRAAKLTGQLLAFARRSALRPETFDANVAVAALGDIVRTLAGSRIKVTIDASADPAFVDADPNQFDTALVNIAANARDAMQGEGRLTLSVGCIDGIPASATAPAAPGSFVAVTIADTGSGIDEETLGRIFEPFFTTKALGKGTGLGLSQVFGFAKQSGGEVRARSVPGNTEFILYLPRAAAPTGDAAPIRSEVEPGGGDGLRVLVVEDNEAVGTTTTHALEAHGFVTVHAADGQVALDMLAANPDGFDAVFSDVMMPGIDGMELAARVRDQYPRLPVLLTSGYSDVIVRHGTMGFDLLHKPYTISQLVVALRRTAGR